MKRVLAVCVVVALGACRSSSPKTEQAAPPAPKAPEKPRVRTVPPPVHATQGEGALRQRVEQLASRPSTDLNAQYWRALAALHLDNKADAADAIAQKILDVDPAEPRALLLRCSISNMRRRYAEFLDRCARVAEKAPASPEAEVALALMAHAQGVHAGYAGRMATSSLAAVDGCAKQAKSCSELATAALGYAMGIAGQQRDISVYMGLIARAGVVTQWTVAGPYGAAEVDVFRAFAGRFSDGIPADPPPPPVGGGIFTRMQRRVPDGILYPARNAPGGIWVAQSALHVPRPSKMVIDVRAGSSVRVFVDGRQLITQDVWSSWESGRKTATVVAVPGWHRLVLEMAADERHAFQVRIMGDSGTSPVDYTLAEMPPDAAPAPAVTPTADAPRALTLFENRFKEDSADVEAAIAVAVLRGSLPVHSPSTARAQAQIVAGAFPSSARAHQLVASTVEDDRSLPQQHRVSMVRAACSAALQRDPTLVMARYRLAVQAQQSRPDEAVDALLEVAKAQPDYPHVWRSLFETYRGRGWNIEARSALEKALSLGGGEQLLDAAAAFMATQGDVVRSHQLREQAARLDDNPFSARMAGVYSDRMEDDLALREWETVLKYHPDHPDQDQRLPIIRRSSDARALRTALETHLARFPSDGEAQMQLCNVLRTLNDARAVKTCVERVRLIDPSSAYPEKLQAEIDGRDLGDDLGPVVDVNALIAELKDHESRGEPYLKDQPTVVLLDAFRRVLRTNGASWFVKHRVVRIGTREAADAMGEVLLDSVEEKRLLRVIKPDGSVVEPEVGQGKAEVSLSGLSPGDVLELRTVGIVDVTAADGMFTEQFTFAESSPILHTEYTLDVPDALVLQLVVDSAFGAPAPTVTTQNGITRHVWRADKAPAVIPEPYSVPAVEHLPRVVVALRTGADVDARLTCRRIAPTALPSPELRALAAALKAGAKTPSELLEHVLDEVRSRIEPDSAPVDAREILAEGRGSHLTLVRALLRAAGVNARVVAARGAFGPRVDVPLPGQHDVLLLVVPTEKGERLLTAVGAWLLDDALSPLLLREGALESDCDDMAQLGSVHALPPVDDRAWEHQSNVEVTIAADGSATGTWNARVVGAAAPTLKRDIGQATSAQLGQWLAQVLVQAVPGADVTGVSTSEVSTLHTPLDVTVKFTASSLARVNGNVLTWDRVAERPILKNMVGGLSPEEYARVAQRKTPLLLSRPLRERTVVRVTFPAGASIVQAPRTFKIEAEGFVVSQDVVVKGNQLVLTRVTHVDVARIPVDQYAAWRGKVEQLVQEGRNRIDVKVAP